MSRFRIDPMVRLRIESKPAPVPRFLWTVAILASAIAALCAIACTSDGGGQQSGYVIPSPTPGSIPPTFAPTVTANTSGQLTVEFFVGADGYTQQGTAKLTEVDEGTELSVSVRPAPGIIQLVSIREGSCDDIGTWLDSMEHAVGGESLTHLPDINASDLLDGNHIVTVSIPDGALSDESSCGEFPNIDVDALR